MRDKEEIDRLLDSALATYAEPGPNSGLEGRVLAAVAAERAFAREHRAAGWWRRWQAWAIAVPVAAALLLWTAVSRMHPALPAHTQQAHQTEREQAPSMGVPSTMTANHPTEPRRPSGAKAHREVAAVSARLKSCPDTKSDALVWDGRALTQCPAVHTEAQFAAEPPLPKRDVFPTPQPLTPQEYALLSVTTEAPTSVRKALAAAQNQDNFPIHIAAIHIPPVEPLIETQR